MVTGTTGGYVTPSYTNNGIWAQSATATNSCQMTSADNTISALSGRTANIYNATGAQVTGTTTGSIGTCFTVTNTGTTASNSYNLSEAIKMK